MADKEFLWGVSTSPYQFEGNITHNDWESFTRSNLIRHRVHNITKPSWLYRGIRQTALQPAGDAVNFWRPEYYTKYFDLARDLGLNSFRIGLEWSRIEPKMGQWQDDVISHYRNMICALKERSLKPIVTLNHITLPLWISSPPTHFKKRIGQKILPSQLRHIPFGDPLRTDPYWNSLRGWENHETVDEFAKFVAYVVSKLKDQVDYWITISEPVASVIGGGYLSAIWPPGFFLDGKRAKIALHNLIDAHVKAYDMITSLDDIDADNDGISKRVGFTHLMLPVSPIKSTKLFGLTLKDNVDAANNFSYFINDYFLNAVINGEEDLNYLDTLQRQNRDSDGFIIHQDWKNKADFIGLDYYRRVHVYKSKIIDLSSAKFLGGAIINDLSLKNNSSHGKLNDLGWEIYPEGLYQMTMKIATQWNKPVLITENGIADKLDKYRAPFVIAHLEQLRRAIDNGTNIIGYLHWSLIDNYEWQEGYRPEGKFGLYPINFNNIEGRSDLSVHAANGAEAFRLIIQDSIAGNNNGLVTHSVLSKAKDKFGSFSSDGTMILK